MVIYLLNIVIYPLKMVLKIVIYPLKIVIFHSFLYVETRG